jgi:hypothetical protein
MGGLSDHPASKDADSNRVLFSHLLSSIRYVSPFTSRLFTHLALFLSLCGVRVRFICFLERAFRQWMSSLVPEAGLEVGIDSASQMISATRLNCVTLSDPSCRNEHADGGSLQIGIH